MKIVLILFSLMCSIPITAQPVLQSQTWQNSSSKNENALGIVSAIATIPYLLKQIFSPSSYRKSNQNQNSLAAQENKPVVYIQSGIQTLTNQQIEKEIDLIPGPGTRQEKWNRLVKQREREQLEFQKEQQLREQQEHQRKQQEFERYVSEQQVYLANRNHRCREIITQIEAGNIDHRTAAYTLDTATRQLLIHNNSNPDKFTSCTGNQLQQYIHQDLIAVLQAANHYYVQRSVDSGNQEIFKTIVLFADVSCDYNNAHDVLNAILLADWCWSAVGVLQKVGEGIAGCIIKTPQIVNAAFQGVAEGFINTGTILLHPQKSFNELCTAVKELAKCSAKVIAHVANVDYYLEHDSVEGHAYFKEFADTALRVGQALQQQAEHVTVEGVVCKTTTVMTEGVLQCKIMNQFGILFSNAFSKAQKLANVAANELLPATEVLVATAEGIEVAVAKETLPLLKNEIEAAKWYVKEYEANNFAQYVKLFHQLADEQITSVIKVTKHGLKRLIERGFEPEEIIDCITKTTHHRMQIDGAKVFIRQLEDDVFNVIVMNDFDEVVSCFKTIDRKDLISMSKNYGYEL